MHPLLSIRNRANNCSVCFASLYRIITITRLVQSTDISWAKSDVFIWSSVEPSIGIISGCLPTLRPLMIRVLNTFSSHLPSTRKSSSGGGSQPYPLNPIETISKKRTRKISKKDDLEGTLVDEVGTLASVRGERKSWKKTRPTHEHSKSWRPDEDEMCLTTTTVHGSDKGDIQVGIEDLFPAKNDTRGITMTKEFDWDEAKRN